MIELYFSTVKILAQRPTHISAVATVLLITKTFTVKERQTDRHKQTDRQGKRVTDRRRNTETNRQREKDRNKDRERVYIYIPFI